MAKDTKCKLSLTLRIDWSEMDTYQHVNNVNFMKYMQSARVQFWEISGLAKLYADTKKGAMLVSTHCDFKHPLFFPGNVTIETMIGYQKKSSFSLAHQLYNDQGVLCATGLDVAVCYDFNTQCTFSIPEAIRETMKIYQ